MGMGRSISIKSVGVVEYTDQTTYLPSHMHILLSLLVFRLWALPDGTPW